MTNFVDLFCGIGGFHKGLTDDNDTFHCVLACDINKECRKTYETNYGIKPYGDIFDLTAEQIPDHHILCGGFSCQPFSCSGKKQGFQDERSNVYGKMLSIIETKRPAVLLLENVKNLTVIDGGTVFAKIQQDLLDLEYNVSYSVLNVADFGLPQNRERVFIVGINNQLFQDRSFCFNTLKQIKQRIALKDIIDTLPAVSPAAYIDPERYVLLPPEQITQQKSGLLFCGYIKGNIRKTGALPNTEHLSRVHKQPNRIYHINGVHPTLSSSECSGRYYIYDGVGVRALTIRECYKIMGFSDDFILHDTKKSCYNQIGNSVCPNIIRHIKQELIRQEFVC